MRVCRVGGVQLVEVIVAGLVFFLISFFLLNLLPTSVWAVSKTETKLNAQQIAFSTLEELRIKPFDSLILGSHPGSVSKVNGTDLTSSYVVAPVKDADPDLVRDVIVTVIWKVRDETHRVEARTFVSRLRL